MKLFVESVAILAPGLNGWAASRAILAGEQSYAPAPLAPLVADLLPPVERRRTGTMVKLALAVGNEALKHAGWAADSVATVFASSGGDGDVINDICLTLAGSDRQVSPTRFHNSVHNAPSGYWSIATHSHHPSTSLCGFDWSFAIGLLEAAAQVRVDRPEVLLLGYDAPYPEPLAGIRRLTEPFGSALLLTRDPTQQTLGQFEITLDAQPRPASSMKDVALERLRSGNPSARALPLLAALAGSKPEVVTLERGSAQTVSVRVSRIEPQARAA